MATLPAPNPAELVTRAFHPGDPHGVEIVDTPGDDAPAIFTTIRPSGWDGWPAEWPTPAWGGRVEELVDTAWSCVDLNASILSTMPIYTLRVGPDGPRVVPNEQWATNPDPDIYTCWEEFAKTLWWDFQLGEAFVICTARYADGWPARFHVAPPWTVNVELDGGGRRRYSIGALRIPDEDMLHLRYKSSRDDAHGHGPLEVGRTRLVAAAMFSRYATNLARTGGVPAMAITTPQRLTQKQSDELLHQWVAARHQHLGLPAVLSGGIGIEQFQINPKDMALVELSQVTEARVAVLLGVPPFLQGLPSGGNSMTYSNVSSLFDYHWRAGLRPKAQPVMAALSQWALPRGTTVEVNRDEYVRPGLAERAEAYRVLSNIDDETGRVLSAADIRRAERFDGSAAMAITGGTP